MGRSVLELIFGMWLQNTFPTLPFLAEDLRSDHQGGSISSSKALVCREWQFYSLHSMAILKIFISPITYLPDLVLYTGTHDNDTTCGWYHSSDDEVRGNFRSYFNIPGDFPSWDMLRMAYRTTAQLVIVPMQDLLSLGSEARLNEPGYPFGNWTWRMSPWQLQEYFR